VTVINELDTVVLTCDLPKYGLKRGDVGTVVLLHEDRGYGVEFMTLDGETVAVVSLTTEQVRAVGPQEMPHSRSIHRHA
jgi:hypothetical protein